RLAELHDVHAALTQRGTDRRARVGLAGWNLKLDLIDDFFRHDLHLLDLYEFHLDGRRTSEDGDRNLERAFVGADLFDDAAEIRERTVDDFDLLSDFECDLGFRPRGPFLELNRDLLDFLLRNRRRVGRTADETRDFRRARDRVPGVVGQLHLHEHVTRVQVARRSALLSLDELDDLLGRNQRLAEEVFLPERTNALLELPPHALFISGVRVHDVPLLVGHLASLSSERLTHHQRLNATRITSDSM